MWKNPFIAIGKLAFFADQYGWKLELHDNFSEFQIKFEENVLN
jgi:hypothetical protein